MKNILLYIIAAWTGLIFTSCDKNAHENEYEQNISVNLIMNVTDPVYDLYLWAFDTQGILRYEFSFASAQELASTTLPLPEGSYTLVVCNHLANAFQKEAKIGESQMNDFRITQADADASPEHAHYGTTDIDIPAGLAGWQWIEAEVSLSRILAELQVTVSNLPDEVSSVTVVVENCATGFFPVGQRLDKAYTPVHLGDAVKDAATHSAAFERMRLMPTIEMAAATYRSTRAESARTHLSLTLHHSHGGPDIPIQVEMPPLLNGGVYEVTIPYGDIRPGIPLQITSINGWKDATPIYGEILNPE